MSSQLITDNVTFDFEDYRKEKPREDKSKTKGDPKQGTVVCTFWLVGLCFLGSDCNYLHRLDISRMPACKYGKDCKVKNCLLKHVDEVEKAECPYFKQGFCMRGPFCKNRYVCHIVELN